MGTGISRVLSAESALSYARTALIKATTPAPGVLHLVRLRQLAVPDSVLPSPCSPAVEPSSLAPALLSVVRIAALQRLRTSLKLADVWRRGSWDKAQSNTSQC